MKQSHKLSFLLVWFGVVCITSMYELHSAGAGADARGLPADVHTVQVVGVRNASVKPVIIKKSYDSVLDKPESVSVRSIGNIVHPREITPCDTWMVNADTVIDFFREPIKLAIAWPWSMKQALHIISCGIDGGMMTWVVRTGRTRIVQYRTDDLGRAFERGALPEALCSMRVVADDKLIVDVSDRSLVIPLLLAQLQECAICLGERATCVFGCCGYLICPNCVQMVDKCPGCQADRIDLLYS